MTVLVENKCILQYARSLVSCKLWHHVEVRLHHQSFGVLCQLPLVDRLWAVDEQPTTNLTRGFSFCFVFLPGHSWSCYNLVFLLFVWVFHPDFHILIEWVFVCFDFWPRTLLVLAKGGWNIFSGSDPPQMENPYFFGALGGVVKTLVGIILISSKRTSASSSGIPDLGLAEQAQTVSDFEYFL